MPVTVLPTRTNLIRAFAAAHPDLSPFQLAHNLRGRLKSLKSPEVLKALGSGDTRRIKSVAE
jgi:hypothetical protein